MSGAPLTDRRRAQGLREALAETAPWLAPDWAGPGQEGDFGAALYEIAARLAEQSTRRLDQTALRDKLAFLETLDIAAPAPRSARVPIVFRLAETRSEPVYAPARVQIAAPGEPRPVVFETLEGIAITPARTLRLIAADPAADRIELAPAAVTAAPKPSPPPVAYRLVSAAEPEATTLQLAQSVGLAAGDLLRIAGKAYRILKLAGEIVTLLDPLESAAAAGTAVEKIVRLESFALRNLNRHVLYIGHKELLKLDAEATITLRLDPPGLARRLAGLDVAFDLWAKPKGGEAGWQPLRLLGGGGGSELRLSKDQPCSVEEVEVEGRKSRWIRLTLRTPIADYAPPATRAASLSLKVSSVPPADSAEADVAAPPAGARAGSRSIVSAFYNGLPLPLTSAFLPFGPEPQRFDTFAIAAPEALTKRQARVTLDVTLSDASLEAMALTAGNPSHVYGIGRNQRLQAIRFQGGDAHWRQLDPSPAAAAAAAAAGWLPLDPRTQLYALAAAADPALDLVFGFDRNNCVRAAQVRTSGTAWSIDSWQELKPPADIKFKTFCLIASAQADRPSQLIAAGKAGLFRRTADSAGAVSPDWTRLAPSLAPGTPGLPALDEAIMLAPAGQSADSAHLVLIDSAGALFHGEVAPAADSVIWRRMAGSAASPADPGIRPAAFLDEEGEPVVVAAGTDGELLIVPQPQGGFESPDVGKPVSILCLPESGGNASPLPLTVVTGTAGYFAWPSAKGAKANAMPSDVAAKSPHNALLLPPGSAADGPTLLLNASKERLLRGPLGPLPLPVSGSRYDVLWRASGTRVPSHVAVGALPPKLFSLAGSWLPFEQGLAHAFSAAELQAGTPYTLLAEQTGNFKGAAVTAEKNALFLPDGDGSTAAGDFLRIDGDMYEVTSITDPILQRTATLASGIPGTTKTYAVWEAVGNADEEGDLKIAIVSGPYAGTRKTGESRKLILAASDSDTKQDRYLVLAGQSYQVVSVDSEMLKRKAILDRNLSGSDLRYTAFRPIEPAGAFDPADLGTLVDLGATPVPAEMTELAYPPPASPAVQGFTSPSSAPTDGSSWLLLHKAWKTEPAGSNATLAGTTAVGTWTQIQLPRSSDAPELSWEYFDGRGWKRLEDGFRDETANFASSGLISFDVPADIGPTDVAGKTDYWIRSRLIGGDYGRPAYSVDTTSPGRQSIRIDRSAINPPEIVSIEARYELERYSQPQTVLTVNNLAVADQTQAAAERGAEFEFFEGLAAHTSDAAGLGRAIYLGLSRAPQVESLSLFIDAEDVGADPLRLQAEVLRPDGWSAVLSEDRTAGLTRPGLLRLFLSPAPAQLPLFGCDGCWLRLRPFEPSAGWAPVVRGLHLNAVDAEEAKSLTQEILGSSLGDPDQSYTLAEAPVLPETLDLRIRESLSDEEKAALVSADPGSIASYDDIEGEWIRWRATDSFVAQGGGARVFRLNPTTGEVRFGDGRDGKIPPAGRDSIRAAAYQSGGGSRGNVRAFEVAQLKTALESVELSVNPVDSGGGADAPPDARLAETAPARLRHAGRALTPPDIEALATGSSPDVVRARCLRGRGCAIDLVVAIRQAGERCPVPSRARREGIGRNIAAVGWGALAPGAIRVRAPSYVRVKVDAVVLARSAEQVAQVEHDVREAILAFLHSTDGGPGGLGWPFGRRPWPSDVQRVAAGVAGVDRVADVSIAALGAADLDRLGPDTLICVSEDVIALDVQPPGSAR